MHFTKESRLRVISAFLVVISLFYCNLIGCSDLENDGIPFVKGFSVSFIDVGSGDSVFINFGDGKVMLIDCGAPSEQNYKNIKYVLDKHKTKFIDYLILTHPDVDHVGNAKKIIENYPVGKAFIPKINDLSSYPTFDGAYQSLIDCQAQIQYSSVYCGFSTDDYYLAFLSPIGDNLLLDYYLDFNSVVDPNDQMVNNLSPIVYLEYKGVTFMFTGDAGESQEKLFIQNCKAGLYKEIHGNKLNLDKIDFLKVGHHGSSDCSSSEFLNEIKPSNAIISVGGNNNYGHPSTITLSRLFEANQQVSIFRTDVCGSIVVGVSPNGASTVYTKAQGKIIQ